MKYLRNRKKGQSTLELALLTICCAGALIAMSGYIVRAMQGAYKNQADELGAQYAPGNTTGTTTETMTRESTVAYGMMNATNFSQVSGIPYEDLEPDRYYFLNIEDVAEEEMTKVEDETYRGY